MYELPRPPADLLRSAPEPPRRPRRARSRRFDAAVALALLALGAGGGLWLARGDGSAPLPGRVLTGGQDTEPAWSAFPGDPAAVGDGRDQELTAVAADGPTVVAAGGDFDAQDGAGPGRAVFLVSEDGGRGWKAAGVPVAGRGSVPRWLAGSGGGWLAGAEDGTLWTSPDGREWTPRPGQAQAAFRKDDRVLGVAGTPEGWMAIGITPSDEPLKATPLLWVSPDGAKWERRTPAGFEMPVSSDTVALTRISSDGSTIRIDGIRMKHLEDSTPSRRDISWETSDGGREWKVLEKTGNRKVPRPSSAYSLLESESKAAPPGGFRHDGQQAAASAAADAGTVFAGRTTGGADTDPVLALRDASGQDAPVDLARVPGVLSHDLTVAALSSGPAEPLRVAVGSRDGRPSLWTGADGGSWQRAALPDAPERGRLTTVAHGPSGWVAAGPKLLYTSPDGVKWSKADNPEPQAPQVCAGPAGYLLIDGDGAWFSKDLASWTGAGLGSRGTASAVAAHRGGFTVLGSLSGRPVAWSSPDGEEWTSADLPFPAGTVVDRVAVKGDLLVASARAGTQPVMLRSADGGATWAQTPLPEQAAVTVLAATGDGFFAAGTAGSDVITWTSPDGVRWASARPQGEGLSGPGGQQPVAAAVLNGALTVLTSSDAPDGRTPFLWRRRS